MAILPPYIPSSSSIKSHTANWNKKQHGIQIKVTFKYASYDTLELGKCLLKVNNKDTITKNTFKNIWEILWYFALFTLVASNVLYVEVPQNTHVANCRGRLYNKLKKNNFMWLSGYLDIEKNVILHFVRLPAKRISYLAYFKINN